MNMKYNKRQDNNESLVSILLETGVFSFHFVNTELCAYKFLHNLSLFIKTSYLHSEEKTNPIKTTDFLSKLFEVYRTYQNLKHESLRLMITNRSSYL